jgi:hypothetical protein
MKRPSFQFYPSDWLRDTALRTCSTGARGLWIDMICFMHEGKPYGHLKVGDKVILPENLARMVGETLNVVEGWLLELKEAGVYDLTEDGVIYSRRMLRDETIRNARAQGGKLGGNPALVGDKVNLKVKQEDKQKSTPSSSSSSSTSINTNTHSRKRESVVKPLDVSDTVWQDFITQRKAIKAPLTETALKSIMIEAGKAGWTLQDALQESITRGWRSFKAEWVTAKSQSTNFFGGI